MTEPISFRSVVTQRHLQVYETFVTLFEKHAQELALESGDQALATVTVSRRQLDRWLRGEVKSLPRPRQCRVLEAMLDHKASELFPANVDETRAAATEDADVAPMYETIIASAERSKDIVAELEAADVGDWTVTQIEQDALRLISSQASLRAIDVTARLTGMVEQLGGYLLSTHRPSSLIRLHKSAGIVEALLTKVSHDIGEFDTSLTFGRSAAWHAMNAEDPTLIAWVRCFQAQSSYWIDNHHRANFYTDIALEFAPPDTDVQVWALNLKARAYAFMKRPEEAFIYLNQAVEARNRAEEPGLGELSLADVLVFNEGLQISYEAQTRAQIDPGSRETWAVAEEAVRLLGTPSGNEGRFGAAVDAAAVLATLHILKNNHKEALQLLEPAINTSEQQKLNGVTRCLRRVLAVVLGQSAQSSDAKKLVHELEEALERSTVRLHWS